MDGIQALSYKNNKSGNTAQLWLVFIILVPLIFITFRNPNTDFGTISFIVRDWLAGKIQIYDGESVYFAYTPWSLLVYAPLSLIPLPVGQLIFNLISLSLLIWSTWYLSKPISWRILTISLTTIYTVMLIRQGQWDAFILASLALGWMGFQRKNPWILGIALVGMTTKYTNVVIPIFILLFLIRKWSFNKIIQAGIIPLITFGTSFAILGWNWPIQYFHLLKVTMEYYQQYEVNTLFSNTVYPVSYRLVLPPLGLILTIILAIVSLYYLIKFLRRGAYLDSISLALALNLIISPYFTFHHIIYLAPSHAQLLKNHRIWGFVLVGAAILDAILLWFNVGIITYPIIALLIFIVMPPYRLTQFELSSEVYDSSGMGR